MFGFFGKSGLDIEGLGRKAVEQLLNAGLLQEIPDIFSLPKMQLAQLDGWGEKSAEKLIQAAALARKTSLARFIGALGIRYIGEITSELLTRHFSTLDALQAATKDELLEVEGIGEQAATSLVNYFALQENREMIDRLQELGLTFQENIQAGKQALAGQVFLFTGSLSKMSRNEAKQLVKEQGGRVVSALSKKVTHLVAGEKAGSKLKKAREMGTNIMDEQEFLQFIG
ncbi:MAG: hypothetical protein D3923_17745 [Candidatus Electrothrix sp. AR3]|nr:hypothetical protein [Candidatus Electrothrix sp. AR3]